MIKIDTENSRVIVDTPEGESVLPMNSPEAFRVVSDAWLRCGWDVKYVYSFAWMGRPVIQLPEDMLRIQEVIYALRPDVIIETGVAHGGSLIFYASLCKAMDKGRIIGIDIEIRPHNRAAIESHALYSYITLVEGSSVAPQVVEQVKEMVKPGESVLVLLDSNHTKQHVLDELRSYASLVSVGSYLVATDGIMGLVVGGPRTEPEWAWDNPKAAALEFVAENQDFVIQEPGFVFNEGAVTERVTYWPGAFVKRIR